MNGSNNLAAEASNIQMASLKTICHRFDWKYDTIYKKWKRGEFVLGYRDPAGRGIRFDWRAVEAWAKSCPIQTIKASLVVNEV